jgi:hypothetical protein
VANYDTNFYKKMMVKKEKFLMIQVTIKMFPTLLVVCYLYGLAKQYVANYHSKMLHAKSPPICIPWWSVIGPEFPVSFRKRREILQRSALPIFLMGRMLMNPTERGPHFRQKTFHPLFHRLFTGPGHDSVASQLRRPIIDVKSFEEQHDQVLNRDLCLRMESKNTKIHPVLPIVAYLNLKMEYLNLKSQKYYLEIVILSLDRKRRISIISIEIDGADRNSIIAFHPRLPILAISYGVSVNIYKVSVDYPFTHHLIATLENHSSKVTAISFSSSDFPDLKIATGDEKGILMISRIMVDLPISVELLHSLQSPFGQFAADSDRFDLFARHHVKSMDWLGNMLVAAYCNKYLVVVRYHNGKEPDVQTYELSINVECVIFIAIHPSCRFLILSCNNGDIVSFDTTNMQDMCVLRFRSRINSMAFALDGKTLAMVGYSEVYMMDVSQNGKHITFLAGKDHSGDFCSIAIHGDLVLTAERFGYIVAGRI